MNNQAVQPFQFAALLGQRFAYAVYAGRALLAHVRETIGGGSTHDKHDLAGMNTHMRRDIGADTSLGPHSSANRDLLYPRL